MSDDPIVPDDENDSDADRNLKAAVAQFRSGDEAGAVDAFRILAEQNSAAAITWLGYIYCYGEGVAVDTALAHQWFLKAAELGDAEAMMWIGVMHYFGRAGKVDKVEARQWYGRAAEAGEAEGQLRLASMLLETGECEEAERWIQASAKQGHAPAIRYAAERQAYRLCNQKQYAEALPILNQIANEGSAWAHEHLGYMYWHGLGVARDFDQFLRHYEAAYGGGNLDLAYYIAAQHWRAGRPDVALVWWRKETKHPVSPTYWQYRVLKKHPHLAAYPGERDELLKRAADSGHMLAKRDIAFRMIRGDAVFGSRRQGIGAWLRLIPELVNMVRVNMDDERLR